VEESVSLTISTRHRYQISVLSQSYDTAFNQCMWFEVKRLR
jgi:hypothetical protein